MVFQLGNWIRVRDVEMTTESATTARSSGLTSSVLQTYWRSNEESEALHQRGIGEACHGS